MHDRLHWSCVARTVFALSHSPRPCICCMAKSIRVEVSDLDISALSLHGHAHLIAWTPRYAYGATARAREGKFTLRKFDKVKKFMKEAFLNSWRSLSF